MTPEQLHAIRARCDRASPGPWQCYGHELYYGDGPLVPHQQIPHEADAAFMAYARADVPLLLDEVLRLQRMVVALSDRVAGQSELLAARAEKSVSSTGDGPAVGAAPKTAG